jgi:hypothetical protein
VQREQDEPRCPVHLGLKKSRAQKARLSVRSAQGRFEGIEGRVAAFKAVRHSCTQYEQVQHALVAGRGHVSHAQVHGFSRFQVSGFRFQVLGGTLSVPET